MNSDDSLPPLSDSSGPPPLDPALEARIAAWVLGEASPAEAAELARLCAEQAEADAFRRRLTETHGLLVETARPTPAELRLAPERRAKLLAALNQNTPAASDAAAVFPAATGRRWSAWALPAAACLALLGLLAAIAIPTFERSFGVASLPAGRVVDMELAHRDERQRKVVESSITPPAEQSIVTAAPSPVASPVPAADADAAPQVEFSFRLDAPATPPPAPVASEPSISMGSGVGLGSRGGAVGYEGADARRLESVTGETRRRHALRNSSVAKEKTDFAVNDRMNPSADGFSYSGSILGSTVVDELQEGAEAAKNSAVVSFKPAPAVSKREWDAPTNIAKQDADRFLEASQDLLKQGDTKGAKEALDTYIAATSPTRPVETPAPTSVADQKALAALAAKGRSQYAAGAFDEAQETFRTMETVSADNAEANYFLRRIADDKARIGTLNREENRGQLLEEVAKGWQRPGVFIEQKAQDADDAHGGARPEIASVDALHGHVDYGARSPEVSGIPFTGRLFAVDRSGPKPPDTSDEKASMPNAAGASGQPAAKQQIDAPKPAPRPAPDASLRLETPSADQPVSTFSLHVSDASFRLARAALARGEFPDAASVRPEEFYNAFDYGDPAPRAGEPVAARVEQAAHPFIPQRNLLRVALRVPAAGRAAGQPLRLVLLLDTSGSMEREDRAAIVRRAVERLAALLGPADRVTLVGFARTPRLLADRLPGDQAASLVATIAATPPEGGTNLDEALKLAADLALRQFDPAAQNRVVLLTDGAANLGDADPATLADRVVQLRHQGVAFDACGVGATGLDDGVLESLTRQGDGRYLLLNTPDEADSVFARQLAGAFRPAAQNVKVQVRFNPARVPHYRLIGFERHRLREQDFRDDRVDAAELAAEEAAVALYQIEVDPQGEGELGEVFVRFRETSTGQMIERSWPLAYDASAPAFDRASPSLRLAGASALLAEKLRGGDLAAQIRLADLDPVAAALRTRYAGQPRVAEFLEMLAQARRLAPE